MNPIDQAISDFQQAETALLSADAALDKANTNLKTAQDNQVAAQSADDSSAATFNEKIDALVTALTAAKRPTPTP